MTKRIILLCGTLVVALAGPALGAPQETVFGRVDPAKVCSKPQNGGAEILQPGKLFCALNKDDALCKLSGVDEERKEIGRVWLLKGEGSSALTQLVSRAAAGRPLGYFELVRVNRSCSSNAPILHGNILDQECVHLVCPGAASMAANKVEQNQLQAIRNGLKIRAKPDDFSLTPVKASPATLSLNRNFLTADNTFSAKGAIGYAFTGFAETGPDGGRFNPYSIVPYVGLDRVEDTSPDGEDTTNIYGGISGSYRILNSSFLGGTGHVWSASARILTDEEADTLVGDANFIYRPIPPYELFLEGVPVPHLPLRFAVDVAARVDAGVVFDDGGNEMLADTSQYLRAGGTVKAFLFANPDGQFSFLEGFALSAEFTKTHGFSGALDDFQYFEAGLTYTFPRAEQFGIGLRYVNGDVATTLEEQEFLEASFTVKF